MITKASFVKKFSVHETRGIDAFSYHSFEVSMKGCDCSTSLIAPAIDPIT
jgi:hypothetical protein